MGNESHENRSSAFSTEQLAAITKMTSDAVRETVSTLMAGLVPAFKDMALTPEKLRAATAPHIDPALTARQKREMKIWKQDEEQNLKTERARKDNCVHMDERGQSSIRLIRNFPDRQARGICMLCHDLITPKEWRIGPPDEMNPRGVPYYAAPHKDYATVVHILSRS